LEFLADYGLFLAKAITLLVAVGIIIGLIANASKGMARDKGHLEIISLNDKLQGLEDTLSRSLLAPNEQKAAKKARKKQEKAAARQLKSKTASDNEQQQGKKNVFVLDFHGDLRASAVASLREEVSAVLLRATKQDEVVVTIETGGGMVHGYGLAASQLDRIRKRDIPLTVCVDKVAASGGYMMACVANRILAAPFAMIGSIGVVAQIPNIHRLLKRHDIDVELLTAGKYKRTLTVLGENTDEARDKFRDDLEEIHDLFKAHVGEYRPQVDIEAVATGEVWQGSRALSLGLVDELKTSDEYLTGLASDCRVFKLRYVEKKSLPQKLGLAAEDSSDRLLLRWLERLLNTRNLS